MKLLSITRLPSLDHEITSMYYTSIVNESYIVVSLAVASSMSYAATQARCLGLGLIHGSLTGVQQRYLGIS